MSKKTTRKALLGSVLALVLCVAMLVGSTFAWFTDSVTSGVSNIQAGKLDVELVTDNGTVDNDTELFKDLLWEPGMVAYENLTVKNVGNLDVKFDLSLIVGKENYVVENGQTTEYSLSDVLKVGIVDGGVDEAAGRDALIASVTNWTDLGDWKESEKELLDGETKTYGVVLYWEPRVDDNNWNVNNGKSTTDGEYLYIDLGANLVATQLMSEEDSFGSDYDKDATYTNIPVDNTAVTVNIFDPFGAGYEAPIGEQTLAFDCYTFDSAEFQGEYPVELYKDWICDYYVSTDKALNEGLVLVGNYGTFGWLGFYAPILTNDINEPIPYPPTPLLGTVTQNMDYWNYARICSDVSIFKCGLVDTMGLNYGTKVTVELRMTSPDRTRTETVSSITVTLDDIKNVTTADAFTTAVAAGNDIYVGANISLDAPVTIPANAATTIYLGKDTTVTAPTVEFPTNICAIKNEGTLTIKGEGTVTGNYAAVYSTGNLTVEGGTFKSPTGFGLMIDNIYGTEPSVAVINGGTFDGVGVYNPTEVTINGGTFNVGKDPDGASGHISDKMTLFVNPTFVGAPNTATVTLNGGTFKGDIYVYDDGITETVFTNNGATITGSILDNG